MNNKVLSCLMAGALSAALALASPAFARGGGGGGGTVAAVWAGGGGMGGGAWRRHGRWHFGGMGGGMHLAAAMHFGGMGAGRSHFGGGRFAGARFAHAGFAPRFSRAAFHNHALLPSPLPSLCVHWRALRLRRL